MKSDQLENKFREPNERTGLEFFRIFHGFWKFFLSVGRHNWTQYGSSNLSSCFSLLRSVRGSSVVVTIQGRPFSRADHRPRNTKNGCVPESRSGRAKKVQPKPILLISIISNSRERFHLILQNKTPCKSLLFFNVKILFFENIWWISMSLHARSQLHPT